MRNERTVGDVTTNVIPLRSYVLSPQQQAVVDWTVQDTGDLILLARAGCGKTSTLIEVVKTIVSKWPRCSTFLGAYNKAISLEIQGKLEREGIDWRQAMAGTLHSAGFGLWRKQAPNVKVVDTKVTDIIRDLAQEWDPSTSRIYEEAESVIRSAVSIAKQNAIGVPGQVGIDYVPAWLELFDHHSLEEELPEDLKVVDVIPCCIRVLEESVRMDDRYIDFDDMLYAPLFHRARVQWPKDFVLIDEAQDTNASRRLLAFKMVRPNTGRVIAVGDDRQAIYGFTGADADSLDLIRIARQAKTLPLTVTYRCPKAIVKEAHAYVPDIVAHESAPEGVVRTVEADDVLKDANTVDGTFSSQDVILCRNTKPIVQLAYKLIRMRVPVHVEGRDIGKGLMKLAGRWRVKKLDTLKVRLEAYMARERKKWEAKGREDKIMQIEDKVETILALIDLCTSEGKTSLDDVKALVESMFVDSESGTGRQQQRLTLSTIHKSKGREWDRVFIYGRNVYMPNKYAKKDWERTQEDNLAYVAITRAKKELVYINVKKEEPKK